VFPPIGATGDWTDACHSAGSEKVFTISAANVVEVRPVGQASPMGSAYARGRPAILNKRTCITQRKKKQKIIQMPSCLPRLVSAEVVAESTGMSVKHVYRLAQLRQIPHYRIGGTVRFDPQEIAEWLELQRIAA
jgi:excisionase family DNA binding protein